MQQCSAPGVDLLCSMRAALGLRQYCREWMLWTSCFGMTLIRMNILMSTDERRAGRLTRWMNGIWPKVVRDMRRDAGNDAHDLIRHDHDRGNAKAQIQRLIDEGLASGIGTRTMADVLDEARRQAGGPDRGSV